VPSILELHQPLHQLRFRKAGEQPMIAASYARKSTDQPGAADDEDRSIVRQVANARACARSTATSPGDEGKTRKGRDMRASLTRVRRHG
jgi:hypothetical protein